MENKQNILTLRKKIPKELIIKKKKLIKLK